MKEKKKNKFILLLILFILIVIVFTLCPIGLFVPKPLGNSTNLIISPSIQKRQGLNQCGPYSVMAVINAITGEIENPEKINYEMKWRLKNQMTIPFGLTGTLRDYQIHTRHRLLVFQKNAKKIAYVKWKLDQGHPMILLNQTEEGIQHYFTVLGYSDGQFYIYDSLQVLKENTNDTRITLDDNGEKPGNFTLSTSELLRRWGQGGKYFFRWYLIESWGRKD